MNRGFDPRAAPREMALRKAAEQDGSTHWHIAPVSFLVLGYVGSGLSAANAYTWLWIGALALNVFARLAIPGPKPSAARGEPADPGARWRAISYLVDAALWAGLIISIDPMPGPMATRVGGSLAVAILISSLSSASRSTPLGLALSWTIPVAAMALHASSGGVIALGLVLWMASVVWHGATRPLPAVPAREPHEAGHTPQGATRRGVQLVIQAAAAPMVAVHNGRVFEINSAAAALLGQLTFDCIGRRVSEMATFDPPNAMEIAQDSRSGTVSATLRAVGQRNSRPIGVRIRMGHARSGELICVLAMDGRAAGEPATSNGTPQPIAGVLPAPAAVKQAPAAVAPAETAAPAAQRSAAAAPAGLSDARLPEAMRTFSPLDSALPGLAERTATPPPAPPAAGAQGPVPADRGGGAPPPPRAPVEAMVPDLMRHLPVLAWVVDPDGRVVHAHSNEVRRWGMRIGPSMRPRWWDAFVYQARSRESFLAAVRLALGGRPTYDLLVERASASGGRLALRSHIVPVRWPDGQGAERDSALVLDTIASARELLEYDRLRRRKEHYKSLVEASPNLIWACDANFRFTFVSRRACRELYAYAVDDLVGVSMGVLLDPAADQTGARRALVGLREGRIMRDVEMSHVTKQGRHLIVAVSAAPLSGTDRSFAGAVGMVVDLTTLKQREASLAEALRVERSVLDSAGQALAVIRDGMVARCNDAFLQLLQRTAAELQAMRIADIFADRSEWAGAMAAADRAALSDQAVVREMKLRRLPHDTAEDHTVWCQLTLRSIDRGEYVLALADIDSIRRREAHALFDARHDELTGLANRRLFAERARTALATSALRNSGCAIVVIDLDRFKQVNDRFGHQAGDEVLQEMARRLQRVVRPQDTVARYGGDEFALLIPDAGARRDIEAIAARIIDELARPVSIGGCVEETLSASVGVALAREQGREPSWLLSLADRAMYEAKSTGGNRAVFAPLADPLDEPVVLGSMPPPSAPGVASPSVGRAA